MLSFRDELGQWDPRAQRRELWDLFNTVVNRGESVRAFPLSNWTELDVWRYIAAEQLAVPSIYFAHEREVFERDALLLAVSPFLEPRAGEPVSRRPGAFPDGRRRDRHGRGRIDGRRRRGDPARDGGHARHRARPDARRRSDV